MLTDQGVRALYGVLVGILVARHLGPAQFGIFSLATSISAIAFALSRLGLDGVLVREFLKPHQPVATTLTSSVALLLVSGIFWGVVSIALTAAFVNVELAILVALSSGALAAQPGIAFECLFQSQLTAKRSTISKTAAILIASAFTAYGISSNRQVEYFLLVIFLERITTTALLFAHGIASGYSPTWATASTFRAWELMKAGLPLLISTIATTIQSRIDQIIIGILLSPKELGVFSAAAKIYETWNTIPFLVASSLLPALISSRTASLDLLNRRATLLHAVLFWASLTTAIIFFALGDRLISATFGSEYAAAATSTSILLFASCFTSLGATGNRYLIAVGMERYIAARTIFSAAISIPINFALIPMLGINGAAIATLVSTALGNYALDLAHPDLLQLGKIKTKAIFFLLK